jgi:hypothetical protein
MKRLLLLSFAALLITGKCHAQTPPHAASTQTWTFGDHIWSDVIRMPECDKADFTESYETPDCRSYTSGTATMYYYNWAYVDARKNTLCPAPWRFPSKNDFSALIAVTSRNALIEAWGLPGLAIGSSIGNVGENALYWASTEVGSTGGYYLGYTRDHLNMYGGDRDLGYPVRCVR